MTATLIILGLTVLMFIIGKVRSDIVALCALTALIALGILTPEEAFTGFSSTVVIMMVGLFVVSGAILQTGLAKAASQKIMKLAAGSDTRLFLLVVLVTSAIGAFVSNTGTVALMMPIVVSMAMQGGTPPGRLLMPLAFASSMGGMLTLIGTPPNLVIQDALVDAGYEPLGFFSFFPVGVTCIAVGIAVMLPLGKMFLNKKKERAEGKAGRGKTLDELVSEYRLDHALRRYRITQRSAIGGKTVAELDMPSRYGLSILEIRNESSDRSGILRNVTQSLARPETILAAGDIVYLTGDMGQMEKFAAENGLERLDNNSMDFYDIGISEIVLMPNARIAGTPLRKSGFREHYSINVLGIKRGGDYIMDRLPEVKLQPGDVLFAAKGVNYLCVVFREPDLAVASTSFFVIRPKSPAVTPEYLCWFLRHPSVMAYFKAHQAGSATPLIHKPAVENLVVPVPPLERQQRIVELARLSRRARELQLQLIEKRETLMQQLLMNKIK